MDEQIGVIELAQYLIGLLDAASFDTTYKLATLEALIRAVSEDLGPNGEPRDRISAREISQHVLIRYWNQTANFVGGPAAEEGFLRQRSGGRGGDLVERVRTVREALSLTTRSDSLVHARMIAPVEVGKLERLTWERVVDMPIPRLQRFGSGGSAVENRFLYDYDWGREGKKKHISLARQDDSVYLRPGVAVGLLTLQPLLVRHIEALWVQLVAQWNPQLTDAGRLSEALFGGSRQGNVLLSDPLADIQNGNCFYCGSRLAKSRHVDHFLPWSVTHNDNIENLVVACQLCNSRKSAALPALDHVAIWRGRMSSGSRSDAQLKELADRFARPHNPPRSISQARSLYLYAGARRSLWVLGNQFVEFDRIDASAALGN